ncbi:MAG: hypothetical protein IJB36_04655 [Clostridia bacterium]|nr:hypothetical protein [Clostridia bacterium]
MRAEFPDITENYEAYLLERYEGTDYPETIKGAGKAVYVERNRTMIEKSRFCVVYCRECGLPPNRKSGTLQALDYAVKKGRVVIKV